METVTDNSGYPLSLALTRRVINYLNGFRLLIGVLMLTAWSQGILSQGETITNTTLAGAILVTYLIFGVYFLELTRKRQTSAYEIAQQTLLLDVLLISLLLYTFQGLSILLVFVGASAGILLPLRRALALAALACLAIIIQPLVSTDPDFQSTRALLQAGLYGLSVIVITALTHLLAGWARDFRLVAERQQQTLTSLGQINELVIRRLRSGVLAVDSNFQIRMMNESAWFLLGSPAASERNLEAVAPELYRRLESWTKSQSNVESDAIALEASQAEVVPNFVALPEGRDVSTLIFLEDNDVVARRALELSALSLAKLSTSIAHEIRNPLAAISHSAQLLAEDEDLDPAQDRMVEIINNQAKRVDRIIENILQLSRREKSQHELLDMVQWLKGIATEFTETHPNHSFELDIDDSLQQVLVMFDPSQLHQVIWKLMDNAVRHGSEQPDHHLVLRLNSRSTFCTIGVEDNGPGISKQHIANIFEPFYTTHKKGTGLGLYLARQLCEANQAELTVDSKPGELTRFHIRIGLASGNMPIEETVELMTTGNP